MPFPRGPKWTIPAAVITASAVLLAITSAGAAGRFDQSQPLAGTFAVPPRPMEAAKPPQPASQSAQSREDEKADDADALAPGPVVPVVFAGNIPAGVLSAYRAARDRVDQAQPGCHLPLELLEAIGKVETNHARNGQIDKHGTTLTPILGPALDGIGFARIPDTEGGRLDGDAVWDRAVGPMQFIPATWQNWSSDGNGDNVADPHNVHDAAVAAGRYLCADNRDLATEDGLDRAILSYNNSESYRVLIRAWMTAYANGTTAVPDTVVPAGYVPETPKTPAGEVKAPVTPSTPPPPAQPPVATPPPVPPATGTQPTPPPTTTPPPNSTPPPSTTPPPTTPPPTTPPPTGTPPLDESPLEPVLDVVCDVTGVVDEVVDEVVDSLTGEQARQRKCDDPAQQPTSASSSQTATASSTDPAEQSAAGS
ncbi:membrane-bound lytic murein transglycosylase B [Kibdelosporangium phytohabitans]|nr:membrane-bound lytic murein transglycosylase B [Kibdelosporangium phytohabitans]